MRRFFWLLIILLILTLLLFFYIYSRPVIIYLAKRQLTNTFLGSSVYVKDSNLYPLSQLIVSDISVRKNKNYEFKFDKVITNYTIFDFIKKPTFNVYLEKAKVSIITPKNNLVEFIRNLDLKSQGFIKLDIIRISDLKIKVDTRDVSLDANISAEFNFLTRLINYIHLIINSMDLQGLHLVYARFTVQRDQSPTLFFIKELKYGKMEIKDIEGKVALKDKSLSVDSLSAKFSNGDIQSSFSILLKSKPEYNVDISLLKLDIPTLIKELDLEEKIQLSGNLSGTVILKGKGLHIQDLAGNLYMPEAGVLTIKDKKILENIAQNNKQSLNIVVESLQNYHYTTGKLTLSLEKGDLILNMNLDGQEGKRNFIVVIHNFIARKGEI